MHSWWKSVKARKDHMCIVCRKTIQAGTIYTKYTEQKGDGFVNLKMHPDCEDTLDDYHNRLYEKVKAAEETSLVEQLDFADPDHFYKDEDDSIQWGAEEGLSP